MTDDTLAHRAQHATRTESVHLPPSVAPTNHGHTTAAWTTTIVVVLGAVVAAVGMVAALAWLAWSGGAVMLLGLVLGKVLQVLGYGQGGAQTLARQAGAAH
ncbi:HGxxPAAW family protein [Cellulomonas soli]|uniref:HGxxPAAW family protein n=1 Tax=Cellulomonas soli TaxID=931535 RepID=UPI003F84278A